MGASGSMNGVEEKRLCKKCGKRLPSSNNYCMFCGCNNDLTDEQINELEQEKSDNNQSEKNYVEREKSTLTHKLIFVFILLDVLCLSVLFTFHRNSILFKKFSYALDRYDKVISLDSDSFLVLKNKKLKVLGENSIDDDTINTLNKDGVVDIEETYPGSGNIIAESKNKIYSFKSSYGYLRDYKLDNPSGNLFKDYSNQVNRTINTNEDYYTVVDENYFIKDDSLYYNEIIEDEASYYTLTNSFTSQLVLSKEQLDIEHPIILGCSTSQRSIAVRGDNVIKLFTDGELIQTIHKIKYLDKEYSISDFKYIFLNSGHLFLVCKNGFTITDYSDIFTASYYAESKGVSSDSFKNIYGNLLKQDTVEITGVKISLKTALSGMKLVFNLNYKAVLIMIGIAIVLLGLLYYFRESGFLKSSFIVTGYIFVICFIYIMYSVSKSSNPDYWDAIKSSFVIIPVEFIISMVIVQIKEISQYLLNRFNIETIYHFPLMIISCTSLLLMISSFSGNSVLFLALPGLIWVFLASNDEDYIDYDFQSKDYILLGIILLLNILLAFVICSSFHVSEYFFCILVVSYSFSCYMVLNDHLSIVDIFRSFVVSNITLFLGFVVSIVASFIAIMKFKDLMGNVSFSDIMGEISKQIIGEQVLKMALIIVVCFVISIVLYFVQMIMKKIIKSDQRLLRIFIMMTMMIIVTFIIILLLPYMDDLYHTIYNLIFSSKSDSDLSYNLFRFLS